MVGTATNFGSVVQIIGPVLDIEFASGKLPKVFNSLIVEGALRSINM